MVYIGFEFFTDGENEQLEQWIAAFDWENHSFDMPNGEVFAGSIGYFAQPKFAEGVAVFHYSPSFSTEMYYGFGASGFMDGEFTEAGTVSFPVS